MGSSELLMVNLFHDAVRVAMVFVALGSLILAFLALRLKLGDKANTEVTVEKAGVKVQLLKVAPFTVFVGMAAFTLYFACTANIPRVEPSQPYDMSTSYRVATYEPIPTRIPAPGVPVRPDENQRGFPPGR